MKTVTANLFTDSQMEIFGVKTATSKRGRGIVPGTTEPYLIGFVGSMRRVVKQCVYSVVTKVNPWAGGFLSREFRLPMNYAGGIKRECQAEMIVTIQADRSNNVGYGFCTLTIHDKAKNTTLDLCVYAADIRNMAQTLNAAANSCGATWRKSSILPN